jgi:DNA-binding MarR family transcriptional regulator
MSQKDPTVDQVLMALRRIIRAIDVHSHRLVQACGLTGPQLMIMRELSRRGTASSTDLARAVSLSNPTVTGILNRLALRDLIIRERSQSDRRRLQISLTPAGVEAMGGAPTMLEDTLARSFTGLQDWERNLILASLQRLAGIFHAEDLDAAPILASGPLTLTEEEVR